MVRTFVENKFRKVADLIHTDSTILDVGCHNGMMRYMLHNWPWSYNYYGIDVNKEEIKELVEQDVKAKQVDLNKDKIPFKHKNFDYILLLDVLEHILDPKKLLSECKERLNKNGRLIITLPNDYHILNKLRFIFNIRLTKDPFGPHGHLHYFSIKDGENELIKEQGFEILKKIIISPVKPSFIPQPIKNLLAIIFPQSFARDILYLIQPEK